MQAGKFLKEIGKGLYAWSYAHAIRFDKDDNLWAIDKGSDMIVRINPEGHVTMVFGRKKEASDKADEATQKLIASFKSVAKTTPTMTRPASILRFREVRFSRTFSTAPPAPRKTGNDKR